MCKLARWVVRTVNGAFRLAASLTADYRRRDRILRPLSSRVTALLGVLDSAALFLASPDKQPRANHQDV